MHYFDIPLIRRQFTQNASLENKQLLCLFLENITILFLGIALGLSWPRLKSLLALGLKQGRVGFLTFDVVAPEQAEVYALGDGIGR